ncbi:MAG TPA: septum formation protein Maf [Clostridiales bacterium]|nr:septum formation protein Maf [Clostridiales bacterium]
MSIILASASSRRRELLEMLGVKDLKVIPSRADETLPSGHSPKEAACHLSLVKAREVAARCSPEDIIIAADTIVEAEGRILGKPVDEKQAAAMLRSLSGRSHRVFTGVTVIGGGRELTCAEETVVRFRPITESEIWAYIATGEPMDKAGAYGAQGIASLFVEGVHGDFFNVMGLPLCRLGKMLSELGVDLI